MSKVKCFSVGNGDMFYINHDSDNRYRRLERTVCIIDY